MTKDEALKLAMEAMEITGGFDIEINVIREALADPSPNFNCKSVQARLATAWGYVKAQPEQEPVAWVSSEELLVMRGNALGGAKDWRINVGLVKQDGDVGLYTIPPQRKPLTDEEIWVLTSEYNDYDQHGEYFEAIFIGKPTSKQIQKHCHVTEQGAVHILNGGGRVKYEDQWYNLRKEKAAHGIKGEA